MPKKKDPKPVKRPALSQDAQFFLKKVFPWVQPHEMRRGVHVDLKGKKLTHRAYVAADEAIDRDYLRISDKGIYHLLRPFPTPPFKLQRVREAYEAFDIFVPDPVAVEQQRLKADIALFSNPLIEVMADLSRVQTDLLCALRFKDPNDPVARIHVRHAIQAIRRLAAEGVKSLETVFESPD